MSSQPGTGVFTISSEQDILINQIAQFESELEIIEIEKGRKTQRFESWNADSFYFRDASNNLAEFIVRYNLKNESNKHQKCLRWNEELFR